MMEIKQKWILENGVFYPIPGDTTLHISPGVGVFQIYENRSMNGSRLGLVHVADSFQFNFKIYDLGLDDVMKKIDTTWNSDSFVEGQKNLGVIFNGLKGTGKTIAAKVLSNKMGIPVVIVDAPYPGLQNFIQSLAFECVVLIDEAEKTFKEDGEVLLKMIDGVYNEKRKLYLLTTNNLYIDSNLLGRPGRIRYIKQFGNLTTNAVNEYIKDNLKDMSKRDVVLKTVDTLEISTIDILKAIVDEVNIHGDVGEHSLLNIPKARYKIDIIKFSGMDLKRRDELNAFFNKSVPANMSLKEWLDKKWRVEDGEVENNQDMLDEKFDMDSWRMQIATNSSILYKGLNTNAGEIIEDVDAHGFFVVADTYNDTDCLCRVLNYHNDPSLYRGELQSVVI
ncbi:MAG: AAA family ATPase [Bacteroidales bacterium]|nr:AAA family ATPase [Bacteroidales bacterium]